MRPTGRKSRLCILTLTVLLSFPSVLGEEGWDMGSFQFVEICDGRDNDTDKSIDEGCDDDNDNYCDASMVRAEDYSCSDTRNCCHLGGNDCDDNNNEVFPGRPEICTDTIDNNCNDNNGIFDSDPLTGVDCNDPGCVNDPSCRATPADRVESDREGGGTDILLGTFSGDVTSHWSTLWNPPSDDRVDIKDIFLLAEYWEMTEAPDDMNHSAAEFDAADITDDSVVDWNDLVSITSDYLRIADFDLDGVINIPVEFLDFIDFNSLHNQENRTIGADLYKENIHYEMNGDGVINDDDLLIWYPDATDIGNRIRNISGVDLNNDGIVNYEDIEVFQPYAGYTRDTIDPADLETFDYYDFIPDGRMDYLDCRRFQFLEWNVEYIPFTDYTNDGNTDQSDANQIFEYLVLYGITYLADGFYEPRYDLDGDCVIGKAEGDYWIGYSAPDSDSDGMPDWWEIINALNPNDPSDLGEDLDGDGLTNLQEYEFHTYADSPDTDGDGLTDGDEITIYNTDPTNPDTDGDRYGDGEEIALGSNPLDVNDPDPQEFPVLDYIGDQLIHTGYVLQFMVSAFDNDTREELYFSILTTEGDHHPLFLSDPAPVFEPEDTDDPLSDWRFFWMPNETQVGNYTLRIQVADLLEQTDYEDITLEVKLDDGTYPPPDPVYPDEVLIVVNDAFPDLNGDGVGDSIEVGEYYRQERGIPEENIVHITSSHFERIPNTEDAEALVDVIKNYLETTYDSGGMLLKDKILYVATMYGVPEHFRETDCVEDDSTWCALGCDFHDCLTPFDELVRTMDYNFVINSSRPYYRSQYEDTLYFDELHYYDDYHETYFVRHFQSLERIRRLNGETPHYLVNRLDGPTVEIAKGLVDKAKYAEQYLDLSISTGYFDNYGGQGIPAMGVNDTAADCGWVTFNPGAPLVNIEDLYPDAPDLPPEDMPNFQPGDVHDAAYYFGWYSHQTTPRFDWVPGAVTWPLHSFTSRHLSYSRNHASIKLLEGATGQWGWIDHYKRGAPPGGDGPYQSTNGKFLKYFLHGYDLAESMSLTEAFSWNVRVGDPLYRPPRVLGGETASIDTTSPTIINPRVDIQEEGIHFLWETNEITHSVVEYGLDQSYGNILHDKFYTLFATEGEHGIYAPKYYTKRHGVDPFHTFVLWKDLQPGTIYYYRLNSIDPAGNTDTYEGSFATPSSVNFIATTWDIMKASWGTIFPTTETGYTDRTIRTILISDHVMEDGQYFRVRFTAGEGAGSFDIDNVALGEAQWVGNVNGTNYYFSDVVPGTLRQLTFSGGPGFSLQPGESIWSDWIEGQIDSSKDYSIGFHKTSSGPMVKYYANPVSGDDPFDTISMYVTGDHVFTEEWSDPGLNLDPYKNRALGIDAVQVAMSVVEGDCIIDSDCADTNPCTADICDSGTCRNIDCDLDGNNNVGLPDVIQIIEHWAQNEGDPDWDPTVDLNGDGNIGLWDVIIIITVWAANC